MEKAYDKVYVNYSTGNFVPAIGEKLNGQDEYIRKDALLEWAKNELESARQTDFDEFGRGEVITLESIIKKLNSL